MNDDVKTIVSRIDNGSTEQRIEALDAFGKQFTTVIASAARTMTTDASTRMFVVDRVMRLAHIVNGSFVPLFNTAEDQETKFLCALVTCQFGSRDLLPWLLSLASTPGPYQYDATRQLAFLGVQEVKEAILSQLRSMTWANGDMITGLLNAWGLFGEPLPEDLHLRLHSEEAPLNIKLTLTSLKL